VTARDVALRYAAKVKFLTSKSSRQITVEAETGDEAVGYIILAEMGNHRLNSECQVNFDALRAKVFGKQEPKVYRVMDVEVDPEWQRKGWGTKLYERALKLAKPALIVTGGCTGMGTTAGAWKIWQGLAKQHPSMGRTQNDFVLAVK